MKGRFRLFMLALAMLSMMVVIGGCSKRDKETSKDLTDINTEETVDDTSSVEENDIKSDVEKSSDEVDTVTDNGNNTDTVTDEGNADATTDKGNKADDAEKSEGADKDYIVGELPLIEDGIKGAFNAQGILHTGTCINGFATKFAADNIIDNYNSATLENEMKPEAILNQAKSIEAGDLIVDYPQGTLELLDWAKQNNMKLRGHTLIWHSQTPQWIFYEDFNTKNSLVDRDTMLARMESYIKQNFELLERLGYIDMFYAYDVVNEAIEDNGTLRNSLWKTTIGDDYVWYAFYYADKYAPEYIKLFYNDYNEQFKTQYIIDLANTLVDENGRYLIDGIGCQGHLYTGDSIFKYMKTLEDFSATGLEVQITELDISLGTWTNILQATDENLRTQGQYYYEFFNNIVEGNKSGKTNVSAITFWGVSDGFSWRRDRSPLLFDLNFQPKYSYFGAIQDKAHAGY